MYNGLYSGTLESTFSTLDAEIMSLLISTGCGVWQCSECGKLGKKGDLNSILKPNTWQILRLIAQFAGKVQKLEIA